MRGTRILVSVFLKADAVGIYVPTDGAAMHAAACADTAGNGRIGADNGKVAVNILHRAGKVQLDRLAALVIPVAAEKTPGFWQGQPMPLKEHGVNGIVILPRQLRCDGKHLTALRGGRGLAFAAKELVKTRFQRVGQ